MCGNIEMESSTIAKKKSAGRSAVILMCFCHFFSLVHPVLAEEYLPAVFALVSAPVRPAGGNGHGHRRGFVLFLLSGGGGFGKLSLEFLKGFAAVRVLKVLLDNKKIFLAICLI